ncbi:hypothetical protein [Arthrobacter sp. MYb227]|uniref:hypothetical protein n=1 Tax=Arthrobacter sp. MYb227 TaxID=1848601 RepID=UPI0011B04C4E|nr:hypothetical protein [Arthrobacter sp. MYb227]
MTFLALFLIAAGLLAHMLLTRNTGSLTFTDYLRAVESEQWMLWAYDGLLILAKILAFSGFIFGRRLAGMGLLITASIAIFGYQLAESSAWSWAIAAGLLFVLVARDRLLRLRQLRFFSPRDAQRAWLTKSQSPRDTESLTPDSGGVSMVWTWLGTLATVIGALLLAGPYRSALLPLTAGATRQVAGHWPLALVAFGLVLLVVGALGLIWYVMVEPHKEWVLLDTGDTDPFEVFEAVEYQIPPLALAEVHRTSGCICARELEGEAEKDLPEGIWPEPDCPRHGIKYLNSLPAASFLQIADQPWVYDEEYELQIPERNYPKQRRVLFNIVGMKGSSLRETSAIPRPGLLLSERLKKRSKADAEPETELLSETLEYLEREEIIDILDLRSNGIHGCVLRSRESMPHFYPEPVPAEYRRHIHF